ncbi:MAG: UDP-N-acetylmuramate--L-alanine ligase [Chloroflexi bacterium]|nr:UDP-N-acetylmuramate--L-alanine ligase [Chloroflexota bacterium]
MHAVPPVPDDGLVRAGPPAGFYGPWPGSIQRIHLVGIGGSGMSALATLLLQMGKQVSGSDTGTGATLDALRAAGARVASEHRAENVTGAEYVIRSAAIPDDNPEILAARVAGIPAVKLAGAVGALTAGRPTLAVAGTHGKTTTTALVAWILDRSGLDPLALIGAESVNLNASALAGDGPVVVEADEYDRRFLSLHPSAALVTSVEADHLDYFRDLAEIESVFQQFVDRLPGDGPLVVCADDPGAARLTTRARRETYGFAPGADWRVEAFTPVPGGTRFDVAVAGRAFTVETSLVGRHNARNVAGALAATEHFGVGLRQALAAVASFQGTRRRFETKGRPRGIWVVDDYAHHPTAIAAVLAAARDATEGALWAVFQPHTSNRTAALFEDFSRCFGSADHAILLPIYRPSGRETDARPVTSEDLAAAASALGHPDVRVASTFDEARDMVAAGARPGDLVLVMGAGDVTRLAADLVPALESA